MSFLLGLVLALEILNLLLQDLDFLAMDLQLVFKLKNLLVLRLCLLVFIFNGL